MTVDAAPRRHVVMTASGVAFTYKDGGRAKLAMEARCRMCETPRRARGVRQLTRHHIVPQSWFATQLRSATGDEWTRLWKLRDADENIVPLCARCHRDVESDEMARAMLRKVLGPLEARFVIATRGRRYFEARYPRLGVSR